MVLGLLLLLQLAHRAIRHRLINSHIVWTLLELQIYLDTAVSYNFSTIPKYQAGKQEQTQALYLFLCKSFNES